MCDGSCVTPGMGYSISFTPRSSALGKRVLELMKEHYRPWPKVIGSKHGQHAGSPSDDLSYDRRKGVIGLDYGAVSGWEREYAYSVVKWMAIRAGRRRSSFAKDVVTPNRFLGPVPYMSYDGYQNWPILVVSDKKELAAVPKTARWCSVDRLGMRAEPWRAVSEVLLDLPVNMDYVLSRAAREAGPAPKSGPGHWAWVERRQRALHEICRKKYEVGEKAMGDELSRLDRLWEGDGHAEIVGGRM